MEKKVFVMPGIIALLVQLGLLFFTALYVYNHLSEANTINMWLIPVCTLIVALIFFRGYTIVQPNEAAVVSFMGTYKGTLKENGFWFINPFYGGHVWSLKVCNYATEPLKVNDKNGVPIEIAATIVYKIGDTYKAQYDVESMDQYIDNQFEISLRTLAKNHTYNELSSEERDFVADLTDKVSKAGVIILDAKITHLNYVPEIAAVMLQKQQAASLGEAKQIIVETAVHIAKNAAKEIENMTQEQKGKFISDLIIVLCSEKAISPVLSV